MVSSVGKSFLGNDKKNLINQQGISIERTLALHSLQKRNCRMLGNAQIVAKSCKLLSKVKNLNLSIREHGLTEGGKKTKRL